MKLFIWMMLVGLCLLCVGCEATPSKHTPGLDNFQQRAQPSGGADAALFAHTTY